jgi:hypothetical protein
LPKLTGSAAPCNVRTSELYTHAFYLCQERDTIAHIIDAGYSGTPFGQM